MEYVTGIFALNLTSPDGTPGDWHTSAIKWDKLKTKDSNLSIFKDWGIYPGMVPNHGKMNVATHIRACLDSLESGDFYTPAGMRDDYIVYDKFTPLIFSKVLLLQASPYWNKIDAFMGKEYMCEWLKFKAKKGIAL